MWTYLVIFFSFALLIGVFVRRIVLYMRGPEAEKLDEIEESALDRPKIKLTKEDSETVEELCKKGESKLKAGQDEEAIKYFVQALAINELHIEAQHKLAMLYMQKQMYAAAAALFKSLGELTDDAVHYSHLGLALYQQNCFEEALVAYQKAVELDPSRPQRFASLAQVYRGLGQLNNAIIALNKAIEADKENVDFLFLLADIQVDMKNFVDARQTINGILMLNPDLKEAADYLRNIEKLEKEDLSSTA